MADKKKPQPGLSDLQAQLDELRSGIALAPGRRTPIGPPAEFAAEQEARFPGAIPAGFQAFVDGDEWEPAGLAPADVVRIQQVMRRAGLLGDNYSPAVWDSRSANAFSNVLALANSKGLTNYEDALAEYARQADTYGLKPKGTARPLTVQYENPEAVRQVIRKSARSLLGQRLSDDEENRLISAFQSQNTAAQTAAHAAGGEAGGSYTAPLTPEEFTASQLEGRPEAGAQRYLDAFGEITKSLGVMAERPQAIGGMG